MDINPSFPPSIKHLSIETEYARSNQVTYLLNIFVVNTQVALADTLHPRRRLEQHVVMTVGVRGVYTYTAMTVVADGEALSEIRHNTRWDRCLLNYAFNHERPVGQQPTYPYLYTQEKLQDETWMVDGKNNPALPCPADNAGDADGQLPAGDYFLSCRPNVRFA